MIACNLLSLPEVNHVKKILPNPTPYFFVVCSEDSSRIGPLGLLSYVHVFNAFFFVVVGGKSDQDFPSKSYPPVSLLFHMGKHVCKIYRYFMKISSFENVFCVLFQDVHAISCSFRPSKITVFNRC